jgi:hypothetical protein
MRLANQPTVTVVNPAKKMFDALGLKQKIICFAQASTLKAWGNIYI